MRINRCISPAMSCLCLIFLLLTLPGYASPASLSSVELLGVAPHDVDYYKASVIKCKDGSKNFAKQQLNDDFCDCPDGTDEPGTSACPEGRFYCVNSGHIPRAIFSSRVNDGICDCCDGSDEYSGKVNCSNTCWEAGKVAREKLNRKIATYREGLVIRKQELEKATQAFAKEEEELSLLKEEEKILQGLVDKLREHKDQIEKAEEEERQKKEEEKRLKDVETNATESKEPPEDPSFDGSEDTQALLSTIPTSSQDKSSEELSSEKQSSEELSSEELSSEELSSEELSSEELSSEDTEGLSRDELGRLVASRWTREHSNEKDSIVDAKEEGHQDNPEVAVNSGEEKYNGYNSENDEDKYKYEDDDDDDDNDDDDEQSDDDANEAYTENHSASDDDAYYSPGEDNKSDNSGSSSWLEKVQLTVQKILKYLEFFKNPVDISEASNVRKEYDDAMSKLSKLQSRISSLIKKLKHNFGLEKEFYGFYDRCFENKQNKYVYKVCPFKSASQIESHSTTQLGRWEKFDDSYEFMQFSNGDKCWNGPDRSMKVMLRCGLKDVLADVDEPSRCEYKAILSSPIFCLEKKLKELQQKLEDLNRSQPSNNNHDEL